MPLHLKPPIPFSLSLFGDHVRFLKGAVAGFATLHDIPSASRLKAISPDQQLQSLSHYHGAGLARLLRDVEGGEYREHVATLRSWGEGTAVALTDFSSALDVFEKELSRSPRELERELKKPLARTQSSLHLPSALLAFLRGECEIDHHGSVFYANGLAVDPLLDLPPMPEVFEYFESATERGSVLRIPSLDLNVYAPPEIPLRDLSAFYACLPKPGLAFYLVEKILYVIPRDENHARLLPKIEDIRKAGLISEVSLLPVIDRDSKPAPQAIGPVLWNDTGDPGRLNLASLSQAAKARWIRGENAPDTLIFAELPILREWLLRHESLLHWSDCRKLKKILETLGFQGHGGQWTAARLEAMQDQIQGILGELRHREEVLARYRSAREEHPDLVLLVEGEIRTPDGKMTSDALIGLLDAGKSELDLRYVFEITTAERSREASEEKHSANLNRRFPEKGLALFDPEGVWGRVRVTEDRCATETLISPEKERADFRELARKILEEMLALVTVRRFQGVVIPMEERRQYARHFGARTAGLLLASLSASLWKEMDRYEAATGRHDFSWLDLQLSSRLSAFPERARPLLLAYLTALRNVVPGLNPSGLRVAATELAERCRVAMGTLFKYQQEIAKELESRSLSVIPDPIEGQRRSVIAAHHVQRVTSALWETADAPQAVESALKTRIAVETDPEILRQLGAYLEALRNVSADLNPSSKRVSAAQIAQPRSSNAHTIVKYQEEIERELSRRSLSVLPDPEEKRKKSRVAGHRFRRTIPTIWEGREKVRDVEAFLRERISAEAEEETKKCLSVYLAVLRNVSADLNPTGQRVSVARVSPRYGLTLVTLARYQDEIVLELSRRSLPFLRDPKGERSSQAKLAANSVQTEIPAVWEEKKTIGEIARALQARVESETDPARKKYLAVYSSALQNISKDLNPSGIRKNASEIARSYGIARDTVMSYQEAIGKNLVQRSLAVIPDPQEKSAKIMEAVHRVRTLVSALWKTGKKTGDIDAALEAHIAEEAENEVKKYLSVYLTVLRNVSADLNPSGERKSAEELGPLCGVTPHTALRYQKEIERELTGRSLPLLPDPQKKIAQGTVAGYRLRGMLPEIWEGQGSAAEVARSLEALIAAEADEETRKYLKAYLAALRELSPSVDPRAPRETAKDIAQRCGVTDTTYRNYRNAIREKLSEKGWSPAQASVSGPAKK